MDSLQDLEGQRLKVENINGGRLAAHINERIKEVMGDILDPNKPAKARREITVTIGFAPTKSRREADIDYVTKAKFAPIEKEKSSCNIRKINGEAFASVEHIEQQELEFSGDADAAN